MIIEPRQKINVERLKLLMSEPEVEAETLRERSKMPEYCSACSLPPPHTTSRRFPGGWQPPTWALCALKANFPRCLGIPKGTG